MPQELTKRLEALVKSLHSRHGRKKSNLCICEGVRCCRELYELQPQLIEYAFCSLDFDASRFDLDFIRMPDHKLKGLAPTKECQGIMFVATIPGNEIDFENVSDPFVVVLDKIGDPGNLGTICRTARAIGLQELWLTHGSVDPYNDKVIRSALASQFALSIRRFPTIKEVLEKLAQLEYACIYRTDPHQGMSCYSDDFKLKKSAILFGSEAHGISEIDGTIPLTIPMPGKTESLNLAQAATVILFEHVRRGVK